MRNDTARWTPPGPLSMEAPGVRVCEAPLPRQVYISGTGVLDRFEHERVEWPDIAAGETYALSLRRDRVLYVGDPGLAPGYHPGGLALTDVTDGYHVLDVTGPNALDLLRRGAELRLDRPSRSVMRRVFGIDILLYRRGGELSFRLHIPRAHAQAVATHLRA